MKKTILLLAAVLSCTLQSCSDDSDEIKEINRYANTSWTATDDISEFVYGKTCTTTIEFFDDFTCQQIDKRIGMKYGAGTYTKTGTYKISNDSVIWTIGTDSSIHGYAKGSALTSSISMMSGGKRVYNKN